MVPSFLSPLFGDIFPVLQKKKKLGQIRTVRAQEHVMYSRRSARFQGEQVSWRYTGALSYRALLTGAIPTQKVLDASTKQKRTRKPGDRSRGGFAMD